MRRQRLINGPILERFEAKCETMRLSDLRKLVALLEKDINIFHNPFSSGYVNLQHHLSVARGILKERLLPFRDGEWGAGDR